MPTVRDIQSGILSGGSYVIQEDSKGKKSIVVQPHKETTKTITEPYRGKIVEEIKEYILKYEENETKAAYKKRDQELRTLISKNADELPKKLPKGFEVETIDKELSYMGTIDKKVKTKYFKETGAPINYPLYFDPLPHQIIEIANNLLNQ